MNLVRFSALQTKSTVQRRNFGIVWRFLSNHVLKNPDGEDHQNIRNFMKLGWDGIVFSGEAMKENG